MSRPVDILLVDDHDENLLALEAILTDPSYCLVRARSGRDALREVLARDFALILDVAMPGLDQVQDRRRSSASASGRATRQSSS